MLLVDEVVGSDTTSLCGLIALSETLRHEENIRKKPIDVMKEYHGEEQMFDFVCSYCGRKTTMSCANWGANYCPRCGRGKRKDLS